MNVEKTIWSAYLANPCRLFSIRELSLYLKKSYPLVHQHVSRLLSKNNLLSKTVGKSILCYPNYNNSYTLLSLALAEENYTSLQVLSSPSISLFKDFFSLQVFPGLVSAFIANDSLVLVIMNKSSQKKIEHFLSRTTLNKKIRYVLHDDVSIIVNLLLHKSVVLFGYEQYHLLIRANYELFASKHNLVKLHE